MRRSCTREISRFWCSGLQRLETRFTLSSAKPADKSPRIRFKRRIVIHLRTCELDHRTSLPISSKLRLIATKSRAARSHLSRNSVLSKAKRYQPELVSIEQVPIKGLRIDRVHGNEFRVKPRLYTVSDTNLKTRGLWTIELYPKQITNKDGLTHKALVVSAFPAPSSASNRMAQLTRQSI